MNANERLVDSLSRSGTFQNYQRAYLEMTGMPLALQPVESWQLPFHGKRKENSFCALMAGNRGCVACHQLQGKLALDAINQPATRTCAYGLCETAVPVKLGSQTIGFLRTGQVMRQKPTAVAFRRAVVQAEKLGADIGNELARRTYYATLVACPDKIKSITSLLAIFADYLAIKTNHLVVQRANTEPPSITKAKQFIAEHYTEELSLRQVAGVVNQSLFYFCKQFRKVTGVNFTEFVSRTRVEKAISLLSNSNLRVSEIAYEVGFQSLTHFNRVFKKCIGRSPTEYRRNLWG